MSRRWSPAYKEAFDAALARAYHQEVPTTWEPPPPFNPPRNSSASARLALQRILGRAGVEVSLVLIHTWPRARQGEAYLWAAAVLAGQEDLPMPRFLRSEDWP